MNREERDAVEALFAKLARVEDQSPPRDPEVEALIRRRLAEQPGAAYYMAQTILVQEQALAAANARPAQASQPPRAAAGEGRRGPWDAPRGGFLAGAAQTALGVTGGLLLGNAVLGMFGGDEAQAATPEPDPGADDAAPEADSGDGGGFFDGLGEW